MPAMSTEARLLAHMVVPGGAGHVQYLKSSTALPALWQASRPPARLKRSRLTRSGAVRAREPSGCSTCSPGEHACSMTAGQAPCIMVVHEAHFLRQFWKTAEACKEQERACLEDGRRPEAPAPSSPS